MSELVEDCAQELKDLVAALPDSPTESDLSDLGPALDALREEVAAETRDLLGNY